MFSAQYVHIIDTEVIENPALLDQLKEEYLEYQTLEKKIYRRRTTEKDLQLISLFKNIRDSAIMLIL